MNFKRIIKEFRKEGVKIEKEMELEEQDFIKLPLKLRLRLDRGNMFINGTMLIKRFEK